MRSDAVSMHCANIKWIYGQETHAPGCASMRHPCATEHAPRATPLRAIATHPSRDSLGACQPRMLFTTYRYVGGTHSTMRLPDLPGSATQQTLLL